MRTQDQQQNGSSPQQPKPPKSLGKRLGLIFLYSFIICMSLSFISNKILHKELSVHIIVSIWAFTFFLMIYLFVKYVVNLNYIYQNTPTNAMYNSQQANYANYPQHNPQLDRPVLLMLFIDILNAVGRYRSNQYAARQHQQQQQQQQQSMANYRRCHPIRKKISTVFAILFILTMGLMGFQAYRLWCISKELDKNLGVEYRDYICVASTITNLSTTEVERRDEDEFLHDTVNVFDAVLKFQHDHAHALAGGGRHLFYAFNRLQILLDFLADAVFHLLWRGAGIRNLNHNRFNVEVRKRFSL